MTMVVEKQKPELHHLVFVPVPGISHIAVMVELARELLRSHGGVFSVTILIMHIPPFYPSPEVSSFLSTIHDLSLLHIPPIPPPPSIASLRYQLQVAAMLDLYKPSVAAALRSCCPVSAVVLDFFCANMIDLAGDLAVPPYIFFTCSAATLAVMLHVPAALDPLISDDPRPFETRNGASVPLPGLSQPLPLAAMLDDFAYGKDELYELFVGYGRSFRSARGVLINTFRELEPAIVAALEEGFYNAPGLLPVPPVYPVGPVLFSGVGGSGGDGCLQWLDGQPEASVVFLCFGSMGKFPGEQVADMAAGLEASGQRFLWVLRGEGLMGRLPAGFEERTRGRGLVWTTFAPQREVLQHPAVGGFVSHCGWNSSLEAVCSGVPMAAWPLYAEQHLNALTLAREVGVAVEARVERWRGNLAPAVEVERVVRELMAGGLRRKAAEMKEKAKKATEEGGSSTASLREVVKAWTAAA